MIVRSLKRLGRLRAHGSVEDPATTAASQFDAGRPDLVRLASDAQGRRDWQAAHDHWQQVVAAQPGHVGAWLQLGNMRNELGRRAEAVACFEAAGALEPGNPDVPWGIAGVYERAGRWDLALEHWRQAVTLLLSPERDGAAVGEPAADERTRDRLAHAYAHAALSASHAGRDPLAAELLLEATQHVPDFAARPGQLALRARLIAADDPARALKLLRTHLAAHPGDDDARFRLASICLAAGQCDEGLAALRPALDRRGDDASFLWLAADLNDIARRWSEVRELCERLAALHPRRPRYLSRAFDAALASGDLAAARRLAQASMRQGGGDLTPLHRLADGYESAGEPARARLLCRWLRRAGPHARAMALRYIVLTAATRSLAEADRLLREELRVHGPGRALDQAYADAAFRAGNFAEARRRLTLFLDRYGADEHASALLGYVLANTDGIAAAEAHFADLAARTYQGRAALVGLAHMAMRRRDLAATLEQWSDVVSLYPEDAVARVEQARAAYELRDHVLTRRICESQLAAHPADVTMGEFHAWFLVATGRFEEAQLALGELRRRAGPNWSALELSIQVASGLGRLDEDLAGLLTVVPQATDAEAGRRLYHVVRQLTCAERPELLPEVVSHARVDPRHLAWLSPYLRDQRATTALDAPVHAAWTRAQRTVRDDTARFVATADDTAIRAILARPQDEQPVVHIVNKFEQARGGSELHALDVAARIGRHARVELWAPETPNPAFGPLGVRSIEPGGGTVPRGGVLVLIGIYFDVATWIGRTRPQRVILLYNTFEAPKLFQRVAEVYAATGVRAELLFCSDMMRGECGLPGLFEPSPTDLAAFRPRTGPRAAGQPFTLGRHSRDVFEKHHPEDGQVYRAVAEAGGQSEVLGGTCMRPAFGEQAGLSLLPARSARIPEFLHGLDAYFYRTSTWIEPWGRVVVEAMASGLPVIACANGGYAQVIEHGRNGLLFRTTEEAVEQVRQVAADPALRERLGAAARVSAESLLGEAAMARLVGFYLAQPSDWSRHSNGKLQTHEAALTAAVREETGRVSRRVRGFDDALASATVDVIPAHVYATTL